MSLLAVATHILWIGMFLSPVGLDSDGDGVPDKKDHCPELPGTKENKGCPDDITPPPFEYRMDRDMDGVENDIDECPDAFGTFERNGCPMSLIGLIQPPEKSVIHAIEEKPTIAQLDNYEMPVDKDSRSAFKDADHDGVYNSLDKCPKTKGLRELYGCPAFSNEEKKMLKDIQENVKFEPYKANMYTNAQPFLVDLAKWLNETQPDVRIRMGIHTDDGWGTEESANLAAERGKVIVQFLLKQGVARERMQIMNFGRMRPLATDYSEAGKNANRRVEVEVIFP